MQTSYKEKLLNNLSRNLIRLRLEKNYSQAEVAEGIDVSLRTYQVYESEKIYDIRISNIVMISNFYSISIDSLIS